MNNSKLNFNKNRLNNSVEYMFYDERTKDLRGNERYKVIKYYELWSLILEAICSRYNNYNVIVELHPTIAGQIQGPIEDEILELEKLYSNSVYYFIDKTTSPTTIVFSLSNKNDIADLVYKFNESDQLVIYFTENVDFRKFIEDILGKSIINRKNQFARLNSYGCVIMAQFHPLGIEMEIIVESNIEGEFNLLLRGLNSH